MYNNAVTKALHETYDQRYTLKYCLGECRHALGRLFVMKILGSAGDVLFVPANI